MSEVDKHQVGIRLRELLNGDILHNVHMETEFVTKGYWLKIGKGIKVLLPAASLINASDEDWRLLMSTLRRE